MDTYINGRWLYSKIKVCSHLRVVERLYSDWIKSNSNLSGFTCEVVGEKSEEKLAKVKEFVDAHGLPLALEDLKWSKKLFVLTIVK